MATYGTADADVIVGDPGDNAIYAREGDDDCSCGDGKDTLRGQDGADTLSGGGGNDQLDGGVGIDIMLGGLGDDTYVVENLGDLITEFFGEGTDTVKASVSYTLGANLENLVLFGAGNLEGRGNDLNNAMRGNAGANGLYGGVGNDSIDGGDGNDTILGGVGNDWLWGNTGVDTVSYADATGAVTVDMRITDSAQQTGGGGRDRIFGFENLTGSDFNDTLTGDAFDNKISGGLGVDAMAGGGGNDRYSVDNSADTVTEAAGEGIDIVLASADYVLGANVENLALFGPAISGTGNGLDNIIAANANGNILNGKGGHDSLLGAAGADTFVFDSLDPTSADHVRDFEHGVDSILVSAAALGGGLTDGLVLDAGWFVTTADGMPVDTNASRYVSTSNPFATTAAHGQFIFDGYDQLWWDADGSGAGQAVMIAGFGTTPASTVDWTDIIVGP